MKSIIALACMLISLLATTAFAADAVSDAVAADAALGVYKGRLIVTANKITEYDFEAEILKIDPATGKVIIKVTSDFYTKKEITRKNCVLVTDKPGLAFNCKGENWHENYEVSGDSLKAKATSTSNYSYSISATKVKK